MLEIEADEEKADKHNPHGILPATTVAKHGPNKEERQRIEVLFNANKTVKEMDVFYPQFGRVEALSASLFNKKVSTSYQLNQATGTTMHLNVQEVGK